MNLLGDPKADTRVRQLSAQLGTTALRIDRPKAAIEARYSASWAIGRTVAKDACQQCPLYGNWISTEN